MGHGLEPDVGKDMDIRLGWIATSGAFLLVMTRLGTVLSSGVGAVDWRLILAASFILGMAASMGALMAGARRWLVVLITLIGAGLALARTAAGATLLLGVIPTGETLFALGEEIPVALELLRFGAPPVLAVAGLIAGVAAVFWVLGGIVGYGASKRRPLLMVIPLIAFYLVIATLDRSPARWFWPAGLALVSALGLMAGRARRATGRVRSIDSGRVISSTGRALPTAMIGALVATAILSTATLAAAVPESGLMRWRNASGFGGLFGGVAFNLFTSMQQDLVRNDATVVFVATVSDSAPRNEDLYWMLSTLDDFDGELWLQSSLRFVRPVVEWDWEIEDFRFSGPITRVNQTVRIHALRQNVLPVLYSPVALETNDLILADSFRAREDGSIRFDTRTSEGLRYNVTSKVPTPDLAVLASTGGALSPIFAAAVADGAIELAPTASPIQPIPSMVRQNYTDLPDNLPSAIGDLAVDTTARASTEFEAALLLEAFFRSSAFTYDASASTGHSTLDLTSWLTDDQSRNYRTGYCEQFATAMAVMARTLDIPSRVVIGFAPGDVEPQDDGTDLIIVRARHAHAWVELFLPSQGWVRFDPTPRSDRINPSLVEEVGFQPAEYLPAPTNPDPGLTTPTGPLRLPEELLPGDDPTIGAPGNGLGGVSPAVFIAATVSVLVVTGVIPLFKAMRRRRRLASLKEGDISAAWAEITDRLRDLGHTLDPSRTPAETAISVDRGLLPLASRLGAAIYGDQIAEDRLEAFYSAEARLKRDLTKWQWWWSWAQPRSLFRQPYREPVNDRSSAARR